MDRERLLNLSGPIGVPTKNMNYEPITIQPYKAIFFYK